MKGDTGRLEQLLKSPPREFSPAPIWWWSGDRLEIERLRWQMDRFVEGGVYNLVVLNLAPTGPLYGSDPDEPRFFSDEWWQILDAVCDYAERVGISIWFYDQIGFSGANLQGEIVRANPRYAGCWLESVTVEGDGPLELECPTSGVPLAAGVVALDAGGRAVGDVVPVPIVEGRATFAGSGRHRLRLAYSVRRGFDYFNPDACKLLFETVHGQYERRVGHRFGKSIVGSFQDELPSMPTWAPDFLDRFENRWGYRIEPHIIALWELDDPPTRQVRVHYHRLRAEMAEKTLFRPLFAWHEKHGLICGFDQQSPSRAGEPKGTVSQYADYIATHRWYQAPGSDHHGDAKIHSSMAHLYGRKRVWIEAFHSSGWGGTIEETLDWLLPWWRAGATLYNPHAVYYSTRGGWWEWAPPSTCWRQPYWRHYRQMATTVSRISALLSEGDHVCDVGVLYPTATIQAGLTPGGPTRWADQAHEIYMRLVGVMHWQKPTVGVLDQDRRDFDVLDDASVQRGSVAAGTLTIGAERYKIIVLPGCAVLDGGTARVLLELANAGGTVVAVGQLPRQVLGEEGEPLLATLQDAVETGAVKWVRTPDELPEALAGYVRTVDAPVPTLLRRVGDAHVLFVPAAYPCATIHHNRYGQQVHYSFDPASYARSMNITVRGIKGKPRLWDVVTGEISALPTAETEDGVVVKVPFRSGPMALVVWSDDRPEATEAEEAVRDLPAPEQAGAVGETLVCELPDVWSAEIVPTLDNRYGDFTKPDQTGPFPVETWDFEHRRGRIGENGSDWTKVRATFGPFGRFTGPSPVDQLPALGSSVQSLVEEPGRWRESVYSLSRGIDHDPLHYNTLGPKGHVPEEFLRFGSVRKGEAVQFCTSLWVDEKTLEGHESIYLALGAAAAKDVWVNGERIDAADDGYHWIAPVPLRPGRNVLEFRLTVEHSTPDLRGYWALASSLESFRRPEWITTQEPPRRDSTLRFSATVHLPFRPIAAKVQLGADAPARIVVNGVEQGRQGGFDPYDTTERVQPYELTGLAAGDNEIVVEVQGTGRQVSIVVDGLVHGENGQRVSFVSGTHWTVSRDGRAPAPVRVRRRQWGDPAWICLWRRPHPLPGASWIEEADPGEAVIPVIPDASLDGGVNDPSDEERAGWFRWILPPGAATAVIPVQGEARLWVDGQEVKLAKRQSASPYLPSGSCVYEAELPDPGGLHRRALLKVVPEPGFAGGGVLTGPVSYTTVSGTIRLGEWADQGLGAYSGALRYESALELSGPLPAKRLILDLGRVRGSVEVTVNGFAVGVKAWSPYRFDVTEAVKEGTNRIEILVCNTLGSYLRAASPTPYVFPGQELSGVYGPVRLFAC